MFGIKKREWSDTLRNKVNELKEDVDNFMNKNTFKEYMMITKKSPSVTKTEKNLSKSELTMKQIVGKFRMHA